MKPAPKYCDNLSSILQYIVCFACLMNFEIYPKISKMLIFLTNDRRIPSLAPCAGRCSAVFGDHVCRNCRRLTMKLSNGIPIVWNQRMAVWRQLGCAIGSNFSTDVAACKSAT